MIEWQEYLQRRRPRGWWVEQVDTFMHHDPQLGMSPLKRFVQDVVRLGYAVRVLEVEHSVWVEVPRKRLFVLACGPELGHSEGVSWLAKHIQEVVDRRKMLGPPAGVFDVIDINDPEEVQRREAAKELCVGALPLGLGAGQSLPLNFRSL